MITTLATETLSHDAAGLPCSPRYGDRYASRAGALGQARHVFLGGNDLPQRWAGRRQFVILETGFGLGNNFLATWQAWRDDPQRPAQLHFVSVELHPLAAADIARPAAAGDGSAAADPLAPLRAQLAAAWPLPLRGLHRLAFDAGRVQLTLALGDARQLLPQLVLGADAFFLDGFAPDRNPQMWEPALLRACARLARPGATLATYTAAAQVRTALAGQGFDVHRRPGYAGKRDMLCARFAPRWTLRRHAPAAPYPGAQQALIIGAGLAGCASALALVRRGWQVTLLEAGATIAAGASGLPAGLLYPQLSADDNLSARLSRAAHGFALRALAETAAAAEPGAAPFWSACGVYQQAEDAQTAQAWRQRDAAGAWHPQLARFEGAAAAGRHLGLLPRHDGIWFPQGAAVDAGRWCAAMLDHARRLGGITGGSLTLQCGYAVHGLKRADGLWQVRGAHHAAGAPAAAAPVLILANAGHLASLLDLQHLPLQALAGSLTRVHAPALTALRAALGGDGYVIPPLLGDAMVGATYDARDVADALAHVDAGPAGDAAARNLGRLGQLLAQPPAARASGDFHGVRWATRDRMPLVGAIADEAALLPHAAGHTGAHLQDLPRQAGLYCLAALGSRGLTLAPLLAELLAAGINGEPAPVETALCAALDPARFLLRRLRHPGAAQRPAGEDRLAGRAPDGIR